MSRRLLPSGPLPRSVESFWSGGFCRDFVENLPAGICICDTSAVIVDYNRWAAKLWGRAPVPGDKEERYGGALKLFHPGGMPLSVDDLPAAQVLKTGEAIYGVEMIVERPDGSRLTISANVAPLFGKDGMIAGVVNCFQDVTKWKRIAVAPDPMQHLEKRPSEDLDQIVRSTAHDLGSQLATIMLNLNLIENRINDPRVTTFVGRARRVAKQSALIVRDLMGSAEARRQIRVRSQPLLAAEALSPAVRVIPTTHGRTTHGRPTHGRPTILMVDDDADLCAVAIESLDEAGYDALHAPDAETALEMIHSERPIDLLLIDYRLIGMNGLEVIKRARAIRPDLKILMMTGQADISRLLSGYDKSIPLLRKPFRAAEFSDRIHHMMLPSVKEPSSTKKPISARQ